MKQKIIVLGMISLLMFSGLSMFTAMGYEPHKLNQLDTNSLVITSCDSGYPDLIPKLCLEQRRNHYNIYVEVHNMGDEGAYFPAGSIIARLKTVYLILPKTVVTDHSDENDLVLEPGEVYRDYAGTDFYINLVGAKLVLIVDPNNVVYEGEDGETNNELEEKLFKIIEYKNYPLIFGIGWISEILGLQ